MRRLLATTLFAFFMSVISQHTFADMKDNSFFDLGELFFDSVEGTVDPTISVITQDANNFIWLGTYNGLYRYDGYSFKRYVNEPDNPQSLSGGYIRSLWPAPDGTLWIGTMSKGVSHYDPITDTFTRYQFDANDSNSLSDNRVEAIIGDEHNNIWIGTNNGLNKLNVVSGEITHFFHNPEKTNSLTDSRIRSLLFDHNKVLWIGTRNGLNKLAYPLQQDTGIAFESFVASNADEETLEGDTVFRLHQTENNDIWVGSAFTGAYRIDYNTNILHKVTVNGDFNVPTDLWIHSITEDQSGRVWLASYGYGIFIVDSHTGELITRVTNDPAIEHSLNSDIVGAVFSDPSGLVWVGTWGDGLNVHNASNIAFRTLRFAAKKSNGLSSQSITKAIELDNGQLWLATAADGVDILDPQLGRIGGIRPDYENPLGLRDGRVIEMEQSDANTVWLGTMSKGLYKYSLQEKSLVQYSIEQGLSSEFVLALLATEEGNLWIGNDAGIDYWEKQSDAIQNYPLLDAEGVPQNIRVDALTTTPDGNVWVGTYKGMFVLQPGNRAFTPVIDKNTNLPLTIDAEVMLVDSQNRIWISSNTKMLLISSWENAQVDAETLTITGRQNGIVVSNLIDQNGHQLWSHHGILDKNTLKWTPFTYADGVDIGVARFNNFTKLRNGDLVFPGSKGVLIIRPENYKPWNFEPTLTISDMSIDGQAIPATGLQQLVLQPEQRSFTIHFTSQDYSAPNSIDYRYKLKGFEQEWVRVDADNRLARYTNIPPGDYELVVQGTNRLGEWSTHEIRLAVQRLPAWNQTWYFKACIVLFSLFSIFLIYAIRTRQLVLRKEALQQEVLLRTQEVEEKNKALKQQNIDLEEALEKIEKLSQTDQLTGANNRRYMDTFLPPLIAKIKRNNNSLIKSWLGLVIVDIDHFKDINDTFGHVVGDKVLVEFYSLLKQSNRESDCVIRFGGEEFLIMAELTSPDELEQLAKRIKKTISTPITLFDNVQKVMTCSSGGVAYPFTNNDNQPNVDLLLRVADKLLYGAKDNGRNAWINAIVETNGHNDAQMLSNILENFDQITCDERLVLNSSLGSKLNLSTR